MYLITALKITVAFFSVIGIYAVLKALFQRLFGDRSIVLAIEILCLADAMRADELIREALGIFLALPSQKIVVITTHELEENEALTKALKRYGAKLYITDL